MNTRSRNRHQLAKNLRSKEYRDAFVEAQIRNGLAFQIRAMRDARGWKQKGLAERINTKQEAVSRLENPDYGRFTLETLRRLASVFDVALIVRFAPFGELLHWANSLTPEALEASDFESELQQSTDTVGNVIHLNPPSLFTGQSVFWQKSAASNSTFVAGTFGEPLGLSTSTDAIDLELGETLSTIVPAEATVGLAQYSRRVA